MTSQDLLSREQDAEAFLKAITPQLMNSEFTGNSNAQSTAVAEQSAGNVQNGKGEANQKTWKNLEANLRILQDTPPVRSVSYKAKPNSSGLASSAFQIEKAQSFKAKTVNTNSAIGQKYKPVDLNTVGESTKVQAVSGIETVLGRHTDGNFKQTVNDEKLLIKKGGAVNGGASVLKAKQESNKATIPSKPGPPAVASVKQEKTTQQKPVEQQSQTIATANCKEPVKSANCSPPKLPSVSYVPSKPLPPPTSKATNNVAKTSSPVSKPATTVVKQPTPVNKSESETSSKTTEAQPMKTESIPQKMSTPTKPPPQAAATTKTPDKLQSTTTAEPATVSKPEASQPVTKPTQPAEVKPVNEQVTVKAPTPEVKAAKVNKTPPAPVKPVAVSDSKPKQTDEVKTVKKPASTTVQQSSTSQSAVGKVTLPSYSPNKQPNKVIENKPAVVTSQPPKPSTSPVNGKPVETTNVSSMVSSFANKEVNHTEAKEKNIDVPGNGNFSQNKAMIEKQFSKDKEPVAKASEPIKLQTSANFSQHKALVEQQLKSGKQSPENDSTPAQRSTPKVKPVANFSQNRALLEQQLMNSGKQSPTDETDTSAPVEDKPVDNGSEVSESDAPPSGPPPPPPPPPPAPGGAPPTSAGAPPPPGGPPPPPPPPPPMGFTVKKSTISDSPSQSSSSAAKKASLIPQDDASAAFLAELKRRTSKAAGST